MVHVICLKFAKLYFQIFHFNLLKLVCKQRVKNLMQFFLSKQIEISYFKSFMKCTKNNLRNVLKIVCNVSKT